MTKPTKPYWYCTCIDFETKPEVVEYNSKGVRVAVYEVVAARVRHGGRHDGRTVIAEHPGQHAVGVREESGERRREHAPAHVQSDDLGLLAVHVWPPSSRLCEAQCGTKGMLRQKVIAVAFSPLSFVDIRSPGLHLF